jgi:hypothetical protein
MTKARFSISVDEEHAERIKAAAARAGQDVSTYMWHAALEAVDRDTRVAEIFGDIDSRIETSEHMSEPAVWPPAPTDGELNGKERAAISARWDAFFNTIEHGAA